MTFRPGGPKPEGSGRQAGVPNKSTQAVREALVAAFAELGGTQFLVELGKSDPATFARLLSRLIPNEIAAGTEAGKVEVIYRIHRGPPPSPDPRISVDPALFSQSSPTRSADRPDGEK